jgi:hypothetical protein
MHRRPGSGLPVVHGNMLAAQLALLADSGHPGPSDCDGYDCATDADTSIPGMDMPMHHGAAMDHGHHGLTSSMDHRGRH